MMQTLQSLPVSWQTVLLLMASNVFMTFAWYGHLKNLATAPWYIAALISWGCPPTASGTRSSASVNSRSCRR